ncbi:sensor histidine kinase [Limnoglobus roseus]|uniref:histidine kinase n=1 Tax=Limnoglobus roseus TaxID=2598579 RepID=A0A5C1A8J5_9BACT|nr:ATP-binding protein [Limnoglobus roseus]QEL14092.1 two-component sensor histidine kinase [Limnoglobus roseus]
MPIRSYPLRVLILSGTSCFLLLVLCGSVAVYLNREQGLTVAALQEDIFSRGVATNLETHANRLATLHDRRAREVEPLHEQVRADLAEMARLADKDEEVKLAARVAELFEEYLRLWREGRVPPAELALFLRERVVVSAEELRVYNGSELKQSEEDHRRSLQRMAWGLVAVGGLGSVAGLVLGYGLARSLRRTIHQFLVRVQGASEMLGQEIPPIEWERSGEPLRDGSDDLLVRVEQVVTKLHQREREVRRAERLAAVGQLAAGMAHEIRNPLTSVILLIETARRDRTAGGLTEEDFTLIEGELHRIEQSLQQFLDYARPPELRRANVRPSEIVRTALALARGRIEQQRVDVRFDAGEDLVIEADADQLRQVVLNLLLNALDVMPHGGTLSLGVKSRPDWGTIELAVSDTGPGIRADILPRLFEPFLTAKETGLGLGLVVSRRIVEDHHGTLTGSNRPEGGACFVVQLPVPTDRSADAQPPRD